MSRSKHIQWHSPQLAKQIAGLEVNEAKRLKELEAENNKLKKLLADKLLEAEAMCYQKSGETGRS